MSITPSEKYKQYMDDLKKAITEKYKAKEQPTVNTEDRMLKWFAYEHLPEHLRVVSAPFGELAKSIVETIAVGPERTVALRKLLEAKDAAVRATVHPNG